MDRAEQRIGNVALVKLQGSRINFHKFCLLPKGGFLPRLRLLQNQPRRRRFAHAGRSVNEDMLRIGTAERRMQGALLSIREKYGKNAILKGMSLRDGATARQRNEQIGGHKA